MSAKEELLEATPELRRALDRAGKDAHERGDKNIRVEDLLRAVLAEPSGAEILRACGADVDALDRELGRFLDVTLTVANLTVRDRVLKRAQMHGQAAGSKQISIGGVLAAMFREENEYAITLLENQGVTRLDILRFVSHGIGKAAAAVELPRARVVTGIEHRGGVGRYQVVMHNDNYTTREFVLETLSTLFGKTKDEAIAVSTSIHKNGTGVVGEYELEVALEKVAKTDRRAEKAGFPLKLSIQPL